MFIEYKREFNKPVIYIFKYVDGKRIVEKVKDFEPYFYVPNDAKVPKMGQIKRIEEGEFISTKNEKLKKIVVGLPSDVVLVRNEFEKTYEADVIFPIRYTIDEIKKIPYEKLRIHYLDIENDDSLDTINTPTPITSIAIWDNFLQKYIVFVWREDKIKREFKWKDKSIYYFDNEKEMLKNYLNFINDTNPDILTGWNITNFDMPYIINRMNKLKIDYKKLSPINEVRIDREDIIIKGRVIFEMIKGYRYILENEPESKRLDDIGRVELGLEKLKFEGTPGKLWREKLSTLIKYNIRDVEILKGIDKKLNIMPFIDELRRMTNCTFNESMFMSFMFDSFLLTEFHNKLVFETRKKGERPTYGGAEVITPTKGLHHNVLHIDIKGQYPSIMISFNMSPETLDKDGDIDVGNGVKFSSKKEGIMPQIEKRMWKLRDEKKRLRDEEKDEKKRVVLDREQHCLKDIMAALYGQTAFPKSRIFSPQVASSITFIGRKILIATAEKIKEMGQEVIYGDTDGLFIKIKEDVNPKDLVKEINKYYSEFCKQFGVTKHVFDIEYEKFYKSFMINSKKRYAGMLTFKKGKEVDEFDVKGFEVRRSDSSRFTRNLQKEILKMILNDEEKSKVKEYVQKEVKKFKNKKYQYEDIAIPRGLTNEPHKYKTTSPWIRGCIYAQNYLNLKFKIGDKARLLYIKQMPPRLPSTYELCFFSNHEVPKGITIDWNKMIEKSVNMKLERIFEAVGWDVDEMLGRNKSLLEF